MQIAHEFETKNAAAVSVTPPFEQGGTRTFWAVKRGLDLCGVFVLLPVFLICAVGLLILNPFFNKGALFYTQERMGRGFKPFSMMKFRSMTAAASIERGADDPVEEHRITGLGRIIRKLRVDELPQILNVLRGEMSLIGPRPEYVPHAVAYAQTVRDYAHRYSVRPGISGLAQVEQGYTEGSDAVRGKLKYDLRYIRRAGFRMEAYVFFRTIKTILSGFGAR